MNNVALTASQLRLLRKLSAAPVNTYLFLNGADVRMAWTLAQYGYAYIGVRRAGDPKGEPVKATAEGRAVA